MKQIEKIAEAENFSAIGLGKLSELNEFVLELNPAVKIPGKVFGGAALQTTGAEFSFQSFAPGTETGFLHTHKTHEELYFFLSGEGKFQVDGKIFPIGTCHALRTVQGRELYARGRYRRCDSERSGLLVRPSYGKRQA